LKHQEGIMTTYTGNRTVKGGYYLNLREWKLEAVDGNVGVLPPGEEARYVRIPLLAMLVVAPVLGLLFVVVLPFLGLAVLIEEGWHLTMAAVARRAAHRQATTVHR
jgi:hypothetical protein